MSHPLWVRGLKLVEMAFIDNAEDVAPFVGAWIEIEKDLFETWNKGRTLRGCVDLAYC